MEMDHQSRNEETKPRVEHHFTTQQIAFILYGKFKTQDKCSDSDSSRLLDIQQKYPDIPDFFEFNKSTVHLNSIGVFSQKQLASGVFLGPFTGKELPMDDIYDPHTDGLWEIHQNGKLKCCLDGSDPYYRNWMHFIQYARNQREQNLTAVQMQDKLYFRATENIEPGTELLVWYDETQYNLYMGLPQGFVEETEWKEDEEDGEFEERDSKEGEEYDEDMGDIEVDDDDDDKATESPNSNTSEFAHKQTAIIPPNMCILAPHVQHGKPGVYSPVYAQYPTIRPPTASGVYTVYPYPMPWVKRHAHSPMMSMPWPGTSQPPNKEPPSTMDSMFVRGADGTRWKCQICQRVFTSQGSLRAHARIHTGEKPYQCKYCQRMFTQASTLRSHERLHTGEKPYKCIHCSKSFTQSAGLRSHLKTHITR